MCAHDLLLGELIPVIICTKFLAYLEWTCSLSYDTNAAKDLACGKLESDM